MQAIVPSPYEAADSQHTNVTTNSVVAYNKTTVLALRRSIISPAVPEVTKSTATTPAHRRGLQANIGKGCFYVGARYVDEQYGIAYISGAAAIADFRSVLPR